MEQRAADHRNPRFIPHEIAERFEIEGAMGRSERRETYVARERADGATVVIRFDRRTPENPKERRHLEENYLRIRRIRHPGLPRLIHLGMPASGGHYLVHEFAGGASLRSLRGHLDFPDLVDILAKLLPPLHLLHLHGVVHQSLTPDKIIVEGTGSDRRVRIVDTGVSTREDGRRWAPREYRAPELDRDGKYDGRADIYSMAVILYEVTTGQLPFTTIRYPLFSAGEERRDLPPVRARRPECPERLEALLGRMGAHELRERPKNALVLARDLLRTGLLSGRSPGLDPGEALSSLQHLRFERSMKEVVRLIDALGGEVEFLATPGREGLADEANACAGLRRSRDRSHARVRIPGAAAARDVPPKRVRIRAARAGVDGPGSEPDRLDLTVGTDEWGIRNWLRLVAPGPVNRRRIELVAKLCCEAPDHPPSLLQDLTRYAHWMDGTLALKWEELGLACRRSLEASLAHPGDHQRRQGQLRAFAYELHRACFPGQAVELLKQTHEEDRGIAPRRPAARAALQYRIGRTLVHCSRPDDARTWMQRASETVAPVSTPLSRQLLYRGIEAQVLFSAGDQQAAAIAEALELDRKAPEGETGAPALGLSVLQAQASMRLGQFASCHAFAASALRSCQVRRGSPAVVTPDRNEWLEDGISRTWEWRLRWQEAQAELVIGIAYTMGHDSLRTHLKAEGAPWRERPVSRRRLMVLSTAFLEAEMPRAAMRTALAAVRIMVRSGNLAGALRAMERVAGAVHGAGREDHAIDWLRLIGSTVDQMPVPTTDPVRHRFNSCLNYDVRDYRMAALAAVRGIRQVRTTGKLLNLRGLLGFHGASLLRLGRFGRAWGELLRAEREQERAGALEDVVFEVVNLFEVAVLRANGQVVERLICTYPWLRDLANQVTAEVLAPSALLRPAWFRECLEGLPASDLPRCEGKTLTPRQFTSWARTLAGGESAPLHVTCAALSRELLWRHDCEAYRRIGQIGGQIVELRRGGELVMAARLAAVGAARFAASGVYSAVEQLMALRSGLARQMREEAVDREIAAMTLRSLAGGVERWCAASRDAASAVEAVFAKVEEDAVGEPLDERLRPSIGRSTLRRLLDLHAASVELREVVILFDREGRLNACRWRIHDARGLASLVPPGPSPLPWDRGYLEWWGRDGDLLCAAGSQDGSVMVISRHGRGEACSLLQARARRASLRETAESVIRESGLAEPAPAGAGESGRHVRPAILRIRSARTPPLAAPMPEGAVLASGAMQSVADVVRRLGRQRVPVVLMGESGVGKEVVARLYHDSISGGKCAFVSVDCPGLAESLAESELFGYVKGSFTGALSDHRGLLQQADGGTLFLDEVGDLPLRLQVKLLRVLSSGEVRRIGSSRIIQIRHCLVSATNQPLGELVEQGRFRLDLLHRLGVAVRIPPLRERPEDIVALWNRFLAEELGPDATYEESILDSLLSHAWPGNVRELRNAVRATAALAEGPYLPEALFARGRSLWDCPGRPAGRDPARLQPADARVARGVALLRSEKAVSRRTYADQLGVSLRTALRDLTSLTDLGLAVRVGAGRASRYVLADEPE